MLCFRNLPLKLSRALTTSGRPSSPNRVTLVNWTGTMTVLSWLSCKMSFHYIMITVLWQSEQWIHTLYTCVFFYNSFIYLVHYSKNTCVSEGDSCHCCSADEAKAAVDVSNITLFNIIHFNCRLHSFLMFRSVSRRILVEKRNVSPHQVELWYIFVSVLIKIYKRCLVTFICWETDCCFSVLQWINGSTMRRSNQEPVWIGTDHKAHFSKDYLIMA